MRWPRSARNQRGDRSGADVVSMAAAGEPLSRTLIRSVLDRKFERCPAQDNRENGPIGTNGGPVFVVGVLVGRTADARLVREAGGRTRMTSDKEVGWP